MKSVVFDGKREAKGSKKEELPSQGKWYLNLKRLSGLLTGFLTIVFCNYYDFIESLGAAYSAHVSCANDCPKRAADFN